MNQSNHNDIFTLSVYHSYFDDNKLTNLQFTPTQATNRLITKFGMRIKSTGNGLALFARASDDIDSFSDLIGNSDGIQSLIFDIYTIDPDFINYTELSSDWRGFAAITGGDNLNEIVVEDLALHRDSMDGHNVNKIGQLHIRLEDLENGLQTNSSTHFELSFLARSTQWRYYIMNQSSISFDEISIISSTGIPFNDPMDEILENGEKATSISSQALIPFSEKPKHKLDLINRGTETKVMISGLPMAHPGQLTKAEVEGQEVLYSSMYIYV